VRIASGPQDHQYRFDRFVATIERDKGRAAAGVGRVAVRT
jgi:hypothetical protein